MVNPVPGKSISTAYGKRGKYWSCNATSAGGLHTGADWAAPAGTKVVAARPGVVRYVNYGSAFGSKQVAITGPDGTEDFYAHMRTRVASGKRVKAGDKIGEVGSEGNATGPHLHFERHKKPGSWNCSNHTNPKASIEWSDMTGTVYLSKLQAGQPCNGDAESDSIWLLQKALNADGLGENLNTGRYGSGTDRAVRACQKKHGFGNDPEGKSNVGPKQAAHLFGSGVRIIDDRDDPVDPCIDEPEPPPVEPPEPPPTGAKIVYWYSGKPSGEKTIGTGYTEPGIGKWTAPEGQGGWLFSMMYLNLTHSLAAGKLGGIRSRMVRLNPVDETAYQDETVTRDGISKTSWLTTRIWFGTWTGGRPLQWEVRRSSSMGTTKATTRYVKVMFIAKDAPLRALFHPIKTWKFLTAILRRPDDGDAPFELSL